ncbi:MAG: hypothetical protein GVY26_06490 [Bacteroidetes bacterium]|jgi:hypothetical protein|nr:hypothetical protein [Bacteroidota bacterium]
MSYKAAKQHLIDGNTKAAIDALGPALENTSLHDEWAMLRARYRRMRESEMKGTLSTQELNLEHNRINDALFRLIDRAATYVDSPASKPASEPAKKRRPSWLGWGIGLAVLALLGFTLLPMLQRDRSAEKEAVATETRPKQPSREKAPNSNSAVEALPADFDEQTFDRYLIRKISGNRDLPFEIHTLGKGPKGVYMEITLRNGAGQAIELGKLELLHTGDKSRAISSTLDGETLAAGQKQKYTPKFRWAIPGKPEGFRMQLEYKVNGTVGKRKLKTDFGIYRKMD